jgi:hypothetical protein
VGALINDGYFTPDEVGNDVAPRIIELASHLRGIIAQARQAVSVAGDGTDVTDWQRGYRACSERVMKALGPGERKDAVSADDAPTIEERVTALEEQGLRQSSMMTNLSGLLRRLVAVEVGRADGLAKLVESHEMRNLATAEGVDHV